ncbi:MAG: DNA repair protein RecO [Syntrophales bacterium]|jgi:DNA repair protein RecO (recombination protein O)|nr:DNA repair protein RecO [Syntrophales bacterium]
MNVRIQCRTEAIVLKTIDYGESDQIVTFYTREYGKIKGIAKGARRSKKRFVNALEPFSCSEINFSRQNPEHLDFIDGCDVSCHFPEIRSNLEKTLAASYLIELMDQFTPENKKSESSFQLLHDFLVLLEKRSPSDTLLRFFEIRLLRVAGYDPVLDYCLCCRMPLANGTTYRFDSVKGGIVCNSCKTGNADAIPVSLGTIKTLLMGRELETDNLGRLLLTAQSAEESRRILSHFIRHILGRELKSLRVLNEINRLQG